MYKQLKLKLDYYSSVPLILIGDRYRLHRIIINLLITAINFTVQKYAKLKSNLVRKTDKFVIVRFIVEDTGIGTPKEKKNIFLRNFLGCHFKIKDFIKALALDCGLLNNLFMKWSGRST
ncbi:hypothetical protein FIV31_07895 [Coxiella endosymbiont of Ornithodoros amblus]|nr:hypothetical protein [Coxiella endosymbiont of Ornithodoros amblus]